MEARIYIVSVLIADTVRPEARQTCRMTFIILASPQGDRETIQASFVFSTPHNARPTTESILGSGLVDVGGSFMYISSERMTVPLLKF